MVALGVSLIALAFAYYIWFKSKRSKQESEASVATLQGQLESLRKQMMELHTGAIGMGQRLQSVEGAMQQVNERHTNTRTVELVENFRQKFQICFCIPA